MTNVCQPGKNLLAAGYCLYSSSTILVLTIGDGVYGFTLDPYVGEFILTHDRIQIPEVGKVSNMAVRERQRGRQQWCNGTHAMGSGRGCRQSQMQGTHECGTLLHVQLVCPACSKYECIVQM